jgi:hypothetical protein
LGLANGLIQAPRRETGLVANCPNAKDRSGFTGYERWLKVVAPMGQTRGDIDTFALAASTQLRIGILKI